MKRIRRWHGRWLLIAVVLSLSVGGSGQWADRRPQSFHPAIALPHGPSPGDAGALGSMGWVGDGRANGVEPGAGLWPEAGADGQYRVIDASRYDRELQRAHELILCQGHRVLWRFGEQLREEALDSIRWSAAGGVLGSTIGTALKSARQLFRHTHNARDAAKRATAQHVFWSGGRAAEDAARAFAGAHNGVVIGDTAAGRALAQATQGVPWSQARPQWLSLSEDFARNASGEVNVFQNSRGLSVDSIWRNEYKILRQNPNVTTINYHVVMPDGSVVRLP